jgi:hypothetical protein
LAHCCVSSGHSRYWIRRLNLARRKWHTFDYAGE